MSVTPKTMWPVGKAMLRSVQDQSEAHSINAPVQRLLDEVNGKLHDAFEHLDTARANILAFTPFPIWDFDHTDVFWGLS